jgi:ABC-type transport system involved in multi-copper enzyme maturation permease subunit
MAGLDGQEKIGCGPIGVIIIIIIFAIMAFTGESDAILRALKGAGEWLLICGGLLVLSLLFVWLFPPNKGK